MPKLILGLETAPESDNLSDTFIEGFCGGVVVEKRGEVEGMRAAEGDGDPAGENGAEPLPRQRPPDPKLPTAEEVAQHNIDHHPHRTCADIA